MYESILAGRHPDIVEGWQVFRRFSPALDHTEFDVEQVEYTAKRMVDHLGERGRLGVECWHRRGDAAARVGDALSVVGQGIDAGRAALDAVWAAVDDGQVAPEDVSSLWSASTVDRSRHKE